MQKICKLNTIIFLFFLAACQGKKTTADLAVSDTYKDQPIFPVTEYILGQLNEIDSLPVTPLKITTEGNKIDSVWMKIKDIRPFAAPFLQPVIDSVSMQKYFSGKSFMDQTINAITLTYDPLVKLPDSIKLNHWDVYIDPQKNTVQRIYMVKEEEKGEETITTQLTWIANKWCSIRTITQEAKMPPVVKEIKMKWDLDE